MPINQHNSSPQKRLANLMAARLAPGADKEKIDKRSWDSFGENGVLCLPISAAFQEEQKSLE